MNIKKKFLNNKSLWWLEFTSLNTNVIVFNFDLKNNTTFLTIPSKSYSQFHTILKYSPQSLLFSTLDIALTSPISELKLYHVIQSFFKDIKACIDIKINKNITTTSNLYFGNTWSERELKEFSSINVINLIDTRKLLLNYNYNNELNYNHYNTLILDFNI